MTTHALQMSKMPADAQQLPREIQVTWLEGYKKRQADGESTDHKTCCDAGWDAVSKKYELSDETGQWTHKSSEHADGRRRRKRDDEDDDEDDDLEDAVRVEMCDALELDDAAGVRVTTDGYMVARPRVARTGIQVYKGREIGRPDLGDVRVYRPEKSVFSEDSLRSYGHRPVTVDHPRERVTAKNWRQYSVGQTGDEVVRDGKFIRIPMVLMDAEAIEGVKSGRDQLSVGYAADIVWGQGVTDDGEAFDATQTNIIVNHLAVVATARGGSRLVIGDDTTRGELQMPTKTILVDGISCEMSDVAASVVQRALDAASDKFEEMKKKKKGSDETGDAATAKLADAEKAHLTAVQAKDGEIAALKKQLADAEMTPQKLDKLVNDRLDVVARARIALGDKFPSDGKTAAEIRRAVVIAKLGDAAAKEMSDAAVEGAFAAFTAGGKSAANGGTDRLAASLSDARGGVHSSQDARDAAWQKSVADQGDAWRAKRPAA